ncbi:hypothetical protein [Pseudoalteromonas sp. OOF1S-7]|uniref:hypothetical protein n=1 Tax=Pseudoalteromonas sp. OOF1S-7 TaxID=2917757 RepID=UPI001EF6F7B8|nr:hypothetical protein [Pseudoalteromonas sp. OOF1S-7]MCG7537521.1 hypothetical protein [Pseudoalteromonas sp. OOF1S-7]
MSHPKKAADSWEYPRTKEQRDSLYAKHASDETVPMGNLLSDIAPKTIFKAIQIMLAKGSIEQKLLPLALDCSAFQKEDFTYSKTQIEQVVDNLKQIPFREKGMKWIIDFNGELRVQFYGERIVNIPYEKMVERVDISRVGDCFRDVLGINTEVFKRDDKGRPTLQIERIAALAQPNYSAFLGKDELDVYKLELQEYHDKKVVNWMKTVCSPNASTVIDDSYFALSPSEDGKGTKLEFAALQEFPLPRIMVLFGLSKWKWYREWLTRGAYRRFWNDTSGNVLKMYAGESVATGKPRSVSKTSRDKCSEAR